MPTFRVTAEHVGGETVAHPCPAGPYPDPADEFDETVVASSVGQAHVAACERLMVIVKAMPACLCESNYMPGSDAWWQSVTYHAVEVPAEAEPEAAPTWAVLGEPDGRQVVRIHGQHFARWPTEDKDGTYEVQDASRRAARGLLLQWGHTPEAVAAMVPPSKEG